ncbi:MAG: hypothetical protein JWQ77_1355 [Jatrophihabitans sp.]|nr:hypothetical protein [Jatrophihabitans sp.]
MARLDDPDVRQLRRLVRSLKERTPDVVYLGDSAVSLVSPTDTDRRTLVDMVMAGLEPQTDVYGLHGAGYNPAMFTQYLRAVAGMATPPTILLSLCVRLGTMPWNRHPYFARRRSIDFMREVDLGRPARIRAAFPRSTGTEWAEHLARRHHTWVGPLTVGEYTRPLKDPEASGFSPAESARLLYAYHHGGEVEQSYLDSIEELGRSLRSIGCRAVAYQTPVPVQRGVEYFGADFSTLIRSNFAAMEAAYRRGLGPDAVVLQTGTVCTTDEFLDPDDGSEHLNQAGRAKVATMLVHGVRAARAETRAVTVLPPHGGRAPVCIPEPRVATPQRQSGR